MPMEDKMSGVANVAGYWTVGIAQGVAVVFVPIVMASLAVGFMTRIVRVGTRISGGR